MKAKFTSHLHFFLPVQILNDTHANFVNRKGISRGECFPID